MRSFVRLLSLPFREQIVAVEAVLCLAIARLLLLAPFRRVAPFLGRVHADADPIVVALGADERAEVLAVRQALLRVAGRLPWHASCLVCAMAGRIMLWRRRMPSVLHLGARSDPHAALAAHAWLRSGEIDVIGAETADRYTPIAAFKA